MSICTAAQAVAAMLYWENYYEKASSSYATSRAKSCFPMNKGSNNYTYPGYLTGVQAQPWCAALVTTAIYEACGSNKADAKKVMYGIWPYTVCNQVWDAAPASKKIWSYHQRIVLGKGDRTIRYPMIGDIIVFTDDCKTRSHTGMVYAVSEDRKYVYTIEGNSANMCRKRSYLLTDKYIYGWIHPDYAAGSTTVTTPVDQYGAVCCKDPELHILSKGTAGPEVRTAQALLNNLIGAKLTVDGIFGPATKKAVMNYQKRFWSNPDGIIGAKTWPKLIHYES